MGNKPSGENGKIAGSGKIVQFDYLWGFLFPL
jgi:hypothetical protein